MLQFDQSISELHLRSQTKNSSDPSDPINNRPLAPCFGPRAFQFPEPFACTLCGIRKPSFDSREYAQAWLSLARDPCLRHIRA